jgi:Cu/Ag efflux protein CusF
MIRALASVLALMLTVVPAIASAATPAPASGCGDPSAPAAAATYEGTIKSVDFQAADALVCLSTASTLVAILVTPGTLVQAADAGGKYRAMSDIKPGERAKIITSRSAGKLTATIVILH